LHAVLDEHMTGQRHSELVEFVPPILADLEQHRRHVDEALSLNILVALLILFPVQMRPFASQCLEISLRLLTRFADGDSTVPIKKTLLLLWRSTSLSMGSNADIDMRKKELRGNRDFPVFPLFTCCVQKRR
jgi:hypothetical protein